MSNSVDLYNTAYGNFATDVLAQVRRETYGVDFGQSSWVTAAEYRNFFQRLQLSPADRVLDIGCGSGGPALFLAREVGCAVTGIDINEAGIRAAVAQARAAALEARVQFLTADVGETLPLGSETFDAIVCLDVMCHLPNRHRLFGEWHRVLCAGGRVLFTDPVVVTGLVTKDELATRSSTGHFEFCPPGSNEQFLRAAEFVLEATEDVTENEAQVSQRWHDARQQHASELIELEGHETFAGLQQFLSTVHVLTSQRRLSRFAYFARKPTG